MRFAQDLQRSGKYWLCGIITFFFLDHGGALEGMIFPVISINSLTPVKTADPNWTEINGEFEKVRDCTFHSVEWYWKGEHQVSRVMTKLSTYKTVDAGSVHSYKGIQLHMPFDQVVNHAYGVSFHKCHPLWLTETRFYP